jgi:signal transduction histidine kinase
MRAKEEPGGHTVAHVSPHLMIYDTALGRSADLVAALEAKGYRVDRPVTVPEALQRLRQARPALLIWADGPTATGAGRNGLSTLRMTSRELGIPMLDVIEDGDDPDVLADWHDDAQDWVFRCRGTIELPWRVGRVLRRQGRLWGELRSSKVPLDARSLPLIVHDLRSPLNVIGLSLRMIEQSVPKGNPDLEEDLRYIEENFKQIDRMLTQLSDYYRLYEEGVVSEAQFSPRRLLDEMIENRVVKSGGREVPVHLEVEASCPAEAVLDPARARQAIQYALANATASANSGGVHVKLRGGADRWIIEVGIDHPSPPTVKPVELRPDLFERLCGIAAERRGMDLAIVARITELFGGVARLDVDEDRGTTIILDWPTRLASMT